DVKRFRIIQKLPHCSPRGWLAILSAPALGRPYRGEGDRAAAPRGCYETASIVPFQGCAITHDRVENGQQLAGDRDEGDLVGLAGCYEALIEGLEHRVVARGDHGTHEQGLTHACPTAADEALAAPLARLPRERARPTSAAICLRPRVPSSG